MKSPVDGTLQIDKTFFQPLFLFYSLHHDNLNNFFLPSCFIKTNVQPPRVYTVYWCRQRKIQDWFFLNTSADIGMPDTKKNSDKSSSAGMVKAATNFFTQVLATRNMGTKKSISI